MAFVNVWLFTYLALWTVRYTQVDLWSHAINESLHYLIKGTLYNA